ncbi:MAG: adenylate/guanylate cyclase domain-containing protein [Acidimicrobiia bacterium]
MGLRLRIGIDTGPAIAGVTGRRKFSCDVWGDTINTVSRMESYGIPDRIQVTERVYVELRDRYDFQPRGLVDVKGKGAIRTYFLEERLPSLAVPPAALRADRCGACSSGLSELRAL